MTSPLAATDPTASVGKSVGPRSATRSPELEAPHASAYEAPSTNPTDPDTIVDTDDEGPEIDQSENEGGTNTATVSEAETTTEANVEAEDGNVVSGDNQAGDDQIFGTLHNSGEGISGDGNINVLTLADVIDIEDSPFLTSVLDNSLNDSVDDLVHNLI